MRLTIAKATLFFGVATFALSAQDVADRKADQQARIAQGAQSGQLTGKETKNLETREKHISRETRKDRAKNGGTLTNGEKAKVTAQQNHVSKSIARDKHNDAVQ